MSKKSNLSEKLKEVRTLLAEMGQYHPFVPRPIRQDISRRSEGTLPDVIASYLSQAESFEERHDERCKCWTLKHDARIAVSEVHEYYGATIIEVGGSVIHYPSNERTEMLVYPFHWDWAWPLFDLFGFGEDDHRSSLTALPLRTELNQPSRIRQRRIHAIELIEHLNLEVPIVLSSINSTSATMIAVNTPKRKTAELWADCVWDFYCQNYAAPHDPIALGDTLNTFTQQDCRRYARHGVFKLGCC
jgi:hypothetical protein